MTKPTNPVEFVLGSENFPGMQSKVFVFVPGQTAFPLNSEIPIFTAAGKLHGITQSQATRIPAHSRAVEGSGFFNQGIYHLPDGIVIKLFAMRKAGGAMHNASVYLRSRAGAALARYSVTLTGYRDAALRQAYIEGRFDFLTVDQAAALGVKTNPMHAKAFASSKVNGFITRKEIAPALEGAPVAQSKRLLNADGESVVVNTVGRKRLLDI